MPINPANSTPTVASISKPIAIEANVCMVTLYTIARPLHPPIKSTQTRGVPSTALLFPFDRHARFVVAHVMIRPWLWLLLLTVPLAVLPREAPRAQQKPAAVPETALSPEQARTALETLNDPKKRAAFTATLEALIKGQPEPVPP